MRTEAKFRLAAAPLLALALVAGACSPMAGEARQNAAGSAVRHPQSGLEVIPLSVVHAGRTHRFKVEVARTDGEQQQGLMYRTALAPDEGMLFPNDPPQQRSFWMKNTVIPLDIIYIDANRRIESINAMTTPYSLTPIPSKGAVIAVLEIAGGRAAELGLAPGDAVAW